MERINLGPAHVALSPRLTRVCEMLPFRDNVCNFRTDYRKEYAWYILYFLLYIMYYIYNNYFY